ncbi:ABC transporter permease [Allopusillimonas ginsengisoli]|uniref:ABC transporter permease n=1 Tax=Allopusillimonas ginsengisoli TaxID=453575 RepID=UPI0039C3B101
MLGFIGQRVLQSVFVMLAVGLIAFSMFRYVGDPISNMVGQDTTMEQRVQLRERLGLNDPFLVQYFRFIKNAAQGDFGISYRQRRPVSEMIRNRMPATLELSFVSAMMALFLGIPMGVYTALRRNGVLSRSFMTLSLIGISLPTFLIGILMILLFGVILRWLPSFGRGEVVQIGWWSTGLLTKSGWQSLIMPAFTLALFQMTLIMRLVRAEMLEVLQADFIKFARARGLPERMINFRHALKNTLVPVITITGLQLGAIIAFSIITETVFQWPGMGLLFIQSIGAVDIPVMSAYLMMIALFFVVINLIVDLLYFAVDPRLRVQKS